MSDTAARAEFHDDHAKFTAFCRVSTLSASLNNRNACKIALLQDVK